MGKPKTKRATAGKPKIRRPGSGRKPSIHLSLVSVDRTLLRAFIERHQGVVVDMVEDDAGLAECGLGGGSRKLSRVTLSTRLSAIVDMRDGDRTLSALDFANVVRVRSGRPGPRRTAEAKRTVNQLGIERDKLIDALARSSTKEDAAAMIGMATRRTLNKLIDELGVKEVDVERRRRQILTCAGCRPQSSAPHTCRSDAQQQAS